MPNGVSETRTWNDVLTTTMAEFENTIEDQIFDDTPLLSYFNGKLGRVIRGAKSPKKTHTGGETIVKQVMFNKNTTISSYDGADIIDTSLQDVATIARFEWKNYAGTIAITGVDRRKNNGEAAMVNLLEARRNQAILSLQEDLSIGAFADGTGNGGKDLTGLAAIVDSSSTLAGLAPGTYPTWASDVNASVGSYAAGGKDAMRTQMNTITFGNRRPDIIITTQSVFEFIEKAEDTKERFVNQEDLKTGFDNIWFKRTPVFFDRDCPTGLLYQLNSDVLNWDVHVDADFSMGPFVSPENQDVSVAKIIFMGNLTTNNRRKLGVLKGITA